MHSFTQRWLSLVALAFVAVSTLSAQSVYWSTERGSLQEGKANAIELIFDSCEPAGEPVMPQVDGLSFNLRGQSSSRTLINGQLRAKIILNYQIVPTKLGAVTIPGFQVDTSQGPRTVNPARFEVIEATVGNTGAKPRDVFLSTLAITDKTPYVGEVFDINYIGGAKQKYQLADLSAPRWSPDQLVTNGFVDDQVMNSSYDGETYLVKVYKANAMATESGTLSVSPVEQDATVVIGRRRDFVFQEPVYDSFTIQSEPEHIQVKDLPADAPSSFNGAVGDFLLTSRVVPQEVQVGEPVTWTLELNGTGNWPAGIGVPARSVSSHFKAIQPEIKNEFAEGNLFSGKQSEDIVLIPTKEGRYSFGPLDYTYFDPKTDGYKTITIPVTEVTVSASSSPNTLASNPGGGEPSPDGSNQTFDLSPQGQSAAAKKPVLLKDSLASESRFQAPGNAPSILLPTTISVSATFALWILLAGVRSVRLDPLKAQRQARKRLLKLSRVTPPSNHESAQDLHQGWRVEAAAYLGLSQTEPSLAEVKVALENSGASDQSQNWLELWKQSDGFLFAGAELDQSKWLEQAAATVRQSPRFGYSLGNLFKWRSWSGVALLALAFGVTSPESAQAETKANLGAEAYESGDFEGAIELWHAALVEAPDVFENRYNLGLAYAQKNEWSRAWAYWTGAYCLNPSHEGVSWNLQIAHQNTPAYDPVLASLLEGEGLYYAIRLRSPRQWQDLQGLAIWIAGGCLVLLVVFLYAKPLRRLTLLALGLSVVSVLLSFFSSWAYSKYEALGEPDSLLVAETGKLFSVPTDLQQEQVSTDARAGTIAKQIKTFLGWAKIELPNGESGWIRQEKLIPLYGAPLKP